MASLSGDHGSTPSHNYGGLGLLILNLGLLVGWLHHRLAWLHHWLARLLKIRLLHHRLTWLSVGLLHHLLLTWLDDHSDTRLLHSWVGWLRLTGNERFVLDEGLLFVTTHFKL